MTAVDVIVICGDAGVGKTTFARRLAAALPATIVDIDANTEAVVRAGLAAAKMDPNDRDTAAYKAIFRNAIHEALFSAAREQLTAKTGVPCVIVAPFTQERCRPNFTKWIRDQLATHNQVPVELHSVKIHAVMLVCDEKERTKRLVQRNNPRDRWKFAGSSLGQSSNRAALTAAYAAQSQAGGNEPMDPAVRTVDVTADPSPSTSGPWMPSRRRDTVQAAPWLVSRL